MEYVFSEIEARLYPDWKDANLDQYFDLELVNSTDSTMNLARELISSSKSGAFNSSTWLSIESKDSIKACAAIALEQTSGRGRKGRVWQSNSAEGLYITYGWQFEGEPPELEALSLVAGVAILRYCRSIGVNCSLKWPNDVLIEGRNGFRKLAGVLTECSSQGGQNLSVYLGIGLNLFQEDFPLELPGISISKHLRENGTQAKIPLFEQVVIDLSLEIVKVFKVFFQKGFSEFIEEYNKNSMINGVSVRFSDNGSEYKAHAIEVSQDGGLLVKEGSDIATKVVYNAEILLS